jgi:hypothetical protein
MRHYDNEQKQKIAGALEFHDCNPPEQLSAGQPGEITGLAGPRCIRGKPGGIDGSKSKNAQDSNVTESDRTIQEWHD